MKTDFSSIYVAHFAQLKRFASVYLNSDDEAEAAVQDVFMELWEKRAALTMPVNVAAFLFTAVKNRCIDYLRRNLAERKIISRLQEEQQLEMKARFDSLEAFHQSFFSGNDIEAVIEKALAALPDKCREIFIKSRFEGKRQKDIAAELGISVNTVETQMGIAYRKLRVELKDFLPLLIFLCAA